MSVQAPRFAVSFPVLSQRGTVRAPLLTTHHAVLYSSGAEVVVLERITDFFLGLNAGQWLKIRVAQISDGALAWMKHQSHNNASECMAVPGTMTASHLLKETGLRPILGATENPPADARHLHHFFGNFGARGDNWMQDNTRCNGTREKRRREDTIVRSTSDAERMLEALAVVRARREGSQEGRADNK